MKTCDKMEYRILIGLISLVGYTIMYISYIPQLINLYKLKLSDQISLKWIGLVNVAIWFMLPLVWFEAPLEMKVGHTISLIISLILVIQVCYYRKNNYTKINNNWGMEDKE